MLITRNGPPPCGGSASISTATAVGSRCRKLISCHESRARVVARHHGNTDRRHGNSVLRRGRGTTRFSETGAYHRTGDDRAIDAPVFGQLASNARGGLGHCRDGSCRRPVLRSVPSGSADQRRGGAPSNPGGFGRRGGAAVVLLRQP